MVNWDAGEVLLNFAQQVKKFSMLRFAFVQRLYLLLYQPIL
jgi:hypothetical protein